MVKFVLVEDGSYRVINSEQYKHNNSNTRESFNISYLFECTDPSCIYSRSITNMRERFENKIVNETINKNNITVLFFGSFLLYQEFQILKKLGDKISEIHLTDYAYENFLSDSDNKFIMAFHEFIDYIIFNSWNINVYIHNDPDRLKHNLTLKRRFDVICGIDIDSIYKLNNRIIMKEIATETLKIDGIMIVSQHNLDQVDLCHYEIISNGTVKLISTEDFVKPAYLTKYMLQYTLHKLFFPLNLLGFVLACLSLKNTPLSALIIGPYYLISMWYKYLNSDNFNDFKRIIKDFNELMIRK